MVATPTAQGPAAIASALITGGGSGIGASVAKQLAERGCDVVISGRRRDALDVVAAASDRISTCDGDVTDTAHRHALSAALAELPEPRAVFHAAGFFQTGPLDELAVDDWRRSFEVNVEARWELSRLCAPLLENGRLLFIGSDAGANPRNGAAAYSIAQAASETLRRALKVEWEHRPVAVGAFKPGLVDTDMVRGFMRLPEEEFPARAAYEEYVSNGQLASPDVVAQFACWLLTDATSDRFSTTEWDVRDESHHAEWLNGALYPDPGPDSSEQRSELS